MPLITAEVLGPPQLRIDGAEAPGPLLWRKNLGLCILLWSSPARRMRRETALTLLWGNGGEKEARHSLNEALRMIRKHLGAEAIDSAGDFLHWKAPLALDCDAFAELESDDPHAAARLIRGAWCEGFTIPDAPDGERWLDDERRRWRHRLVDVLASATDRAADLGQLHQAREWSSAAHRLDPLHEPAARARIRSLALSGDRNGALAEAEAFSARVLEELGMPVSTETAMLLRRVAALRQPRRAPAQEAPRREVPFTGRAQAMKRLLGASRKAQHGSASIMMLLEGEPGSGCTRLLEELALRAALEGFTVVTVRAVPGDASYPGAGLKAIAACGLARLPGTAALGPEALATLIGAAPEWSERFSPDPSAVPVPLEDALVAALRAAAAERPVMLAIDDVGCLDAESLLQLPRMLRGLANMPFAMAVVTRLGDVRPETDALRSHVDRAQRGIHVAVDPLRESDVLVAVQQVLPEWNAEAQERLTRRLWAESAGLPAVAIGILEAVVRGLAVEDLDGPWPAPDHTMDATLPSPMPGTLTAATRMRFHQLDDLDRQLLGLIAVEGSTIRADRLCRLVQRGEDEVDEHLDALESERWLVVDSRGYRYRARAVGTLVAAELMTPGQRRRIEARLAEN